MEKLLTLSEVAGILGISGTTARIWACRRRIPVVKVGRLVRVSPQALAAWISDNTEHDPGARRGMKPPLPHPERKRTDFESRIKELRGDGN